MSRHAVYRALVQLAMCLVLASTLPQTVWAGSRVKNHDDLKPVFSITDDAVWKLHPWGAWLVGFDISPDGRIFASEFDALEEGQQASVWVGEWDIATGKLITERPIEGPTPVKDLMSDQHILDLQFASGGQKLLALTGTRILALDAARLTALYSIHPAKIQTTSRYGVIIRQVSVSADGKLLAVVSSGAGYPWGTTDTRLLSIQTGEELADWNFSQGDWPDVFSLSSDGNEMLVSHSQAGDRLPACVLLMDSRTGAVSKTFDSRFGGSQFDYYGYAEFIDNNQFLVTSIGRSHTALKVIDLHTGKVVQTFGYSKHDAQAWAVAASGAPLIAALIFSWKWGIGSDLDAPLTRYVDWLGLFRLGEQEPLHVRRNVPLFQGGGPGALTLRSTMRISRDGKVLALGSGRTIWVYRLSLGQQAGRAKD